MARRRRKKNVDWGAVTAATISALTVSVVTVGAIMIINKKQREAIAAGGNGTP
jgi:hypothetical protein